MYIEIFDKTKELVLTSDLLEKNIDESLIKSLLCREKFNEYAILSMMYMSDFVVFEMNNDALLGIICVHSDANEWNITLICSVENKLGMGSKLLQKVIDLSRINNVRKLFGMGHLDGSRKLYQKFNFNENNELIFGGKKSRTNTRKSSRKKCKKSTKKRRNKNKLYYNNKLLKDN